MATDRTNYRVSVRLEFELEFDTDLGTEEECKALARRIINDAYLQSDTIDEATESSYASHIYNRSGPGIRNRDICYITVRRSDGWRVRNEPYTYLNAYLWEVKQLRALQAEQKLLPAGAEHLLDGIVADKQRACDDLAHKLATGQETEGTDAH